MSWFKDNIESMKAYVPGEPAGGGRVVKLNQNENPYPPSPRALAAIREFDGASLRLYPDPMAGKFRRVASEVLSVPAEWILPGDGSDDLIIMISRAALGPGRAVVYPVPTFPFYFTQGQIEGARIVEVACDEDFRLPVDALAKAQGAVTFLASPNSPTGQAASLEELDWLAGQLGGMLVIDEAYADFASLSALPLVETHANVLVMRTLSKGYSLAGLRWGFGIAQPALRDGLLKTKAIYNVGTLPAAVAAAALADQAYHDDCVAKILRQRERLAKDLGARGWRVWPSEGNFLLVRPPGGDGRAVCEALKARGVLVRYFPQDAMRDKLRITVGRPEENDALLAAWDDIAKAAR